jgi:hypothetical protein
MPEFCPAARVPDDIEAPGTSRLALPATPNQASRRRAAAKLFALLYEIY